MAKTNPKILLFTENFEKRIIAKDIVGITNLESFLNNNKNKNRIKLKGVTSCCKDSRGIYVEKDHTRGYQILNTNHIDFVYGPRSLIYSQDNLASYSEASLLWGMKGLHHALIGDIRVPGNNMPKIDKNLSKEDLDKKESELVDYLDKQIQKNFIPLYNPRTDGLDAKREFKRLFEEIAFPNEQLSRILVNNKKQSLSNTSQAIYLGPSSKNYR